MRTSWWVASLAAAAALASLAWAQLPPADAPVADYDDPSSAMAAERIHTPHASLIEGPFADATEVTRACLECHPEAAEQVMHTSHWTWAGQEVLDPATGEVVAVGKTNVINNFCIGTEPNMEMCSRCHAGYGWTDSSFDHAAEERVDCLVCHADLGTYTKAAGGWPGDAVDLVAAARSVREPTRDNCGLCHFDGGGGNGVKHGDLDSSLAHPTERVDVHMGALDFQCHDCHRTEEHVIPGCSFGVCLDRGPRVECTDCHDPRPHGRDRLDAHTDTVACQTCHIPEMAIDIPTKLQWDWSTAGQDLPEDPHTYMKIKGSFVYGQDVAPEYGWYARSAGASRYLKGQPVDPEEVLQLNALCGEPADPDARIWPLKVHRGKQPYDAVHRYLLVPKTVGEGGYWTDFDWDQAFRLAEESTGLAYSGEYGFVETSMVWPLSHMVRPADEALQCRDCHGDDGRLDWDALGYDGDPAFGEEGLRMDLVQDPVAFRGAQGLDRPVQPLRYDIDWDEPRNPVCRAPAEEVSP